MIMSPLRYESDGTDASSLGQPLKFEFSGKIAQNRFLKAAMTERMSSWDPRDFEKRGIPSKELINVYKRWGEGGFGQILTGNIMIEYDHLEAMGNMIITSKNEFSGARFDAFQKLAMAAKAHGSLIVAQLCHTGRQVDIRIQKNPISASDVQLIGNAMRMEFAKPHAASTQEMAHTKNSFAHAAEFLYKAGYDGVELHAAHGYLLGQFLALSTNKRTDEYGGTLRNRLRFIVEIADECRKRVSKDFIIGIKINSVEFEEGGFSPEEAQTLVEQLEIAQFDFVELSGGTYEKSAFKHQRESTKNREAFFLEFAEDIVKNLRKTKTYVTGGFRTVGAMVHALNIVDGISLGRTVCQEFDLPKKILEQSVLGAIKGLLNEDDFGLTNLAAGTQMQQVGNDLQPIDLSNQNDVKLFGEELGNFFQKMASDTEMKEYGYVKLTQLAKPYATFTT